MLTPVFLYSGDFHCDEFLRDDVHCPALLSGKNTLYRTHNMWLNNEVQKTILPLCQSTKSVQSHKPKNNQSQPIIIFVGGFLDSIHRVVFREFASFTLDSCAQFSSIPFVAKIYTTFYCKRLFVSLLPEILALGYTPYIIAHSWGASNICKALENLKEKLPRNSIPILLTLDPVGYWRPTHEIECVEKWVNIYIADKWKYCFKSSNICTFIGHAWNECKYANKNISIKNKHLSDISDKKFITPRKKPINHASVRTMLSVFNKNLS
ncbi:hypothetical protein [Helicobacter sp. 23-1046]